MPSLTLTGALLLASLLSAQGALAATVTKTIDFTATDFTSYTGSEPVPVDTVTGSFTLTFDPALDYFDETAGIVLHNINIDVSGSPMFWRVGGTYFGANIGMSIGGGSMSLLHGTDDFLFSFNLSGPAGPLTAQFGYSQDGILDFFSTENVALTVNPPLVLTPIPGSVLMLLTGLGAIGVIGFFRKRNASTALVAAA